MSNRPLADPHTGLTPAEQTFVNLLLDVGENKPKSLTDAYCRAFGIKSPNKSESVKASRLLRTPRVESALQSARQRMAIEANRKSLTTKSALESRLWEIVDSGSRDSDRIAAIRELRAFQPDVIEEVTALDRGTIVARVRALLATALGVEHGSVTTDEHASSVPIEAYASSMPSDAIDIVSTPDPIDALSTDPGSPTEIDPPSY